MAGVPWCKRELEIASQLVGKLTALEISRVLSELGYERSPCSVRGYFANKCISTSLADSRHPEIEGDEKLVEAVNAVLAERPSTNVELPTGALPYGHSMRGVSTLVDSEGNIKQQWVKTGSQTETREEVLRRLLEELPRTLTPKPVKSKFQLKGFSSDILSVYPVGDPHIGMLAWGEESGEDFDMDIAKSRLQAAMSYLVGKSEPTERALVINLGDFFHADNNAGVTSRSGNSLDVDTRWAKILRTGLGVKINMIEAALTRHKYVDVIVEIGNHDDHSAIFLSVALDAYYRNEPRVSVDMSPAKFHYATFGQNLIGVTHGDSVKPTDLESIMSCDKAEEWGNTMYRYWYIGHIHHSRKWEFRGCTVESFRTLAPKDAWHSSAGYRARNDMTKILLHRNFGEIARHSIDSRFLKMMGAK